MLHRIKIPLILVLASIILLFFTKENQDLYRVILMFVIVFLGWLVVKALNLKRLDE